MTWPRVSLAIIGDDFYYTLHFHKLSGKSLHERVFSRHCCRLMVVMRVVRTFALEKSTNPFKRYNNEAQEN